MLYGLYQVATKKRLGGLFIIIVALPFVTLIKSYIVIPLSLSFSAFWALERAHASGRRIKLHTKSIHILLGLGFAIGVVLLIGKIFPRFALENLAEETSRLQAYAKHNRGGSTIQIGSGQANSLSQQVTFVPMALSNSLFRPFIFEAHNAVALINAMETTALLGGMIWGVRNYGLRGLFSIVFRSPVASFCIIFTIFFGIGVGLSTTNLGTLSRYRVPMMPFYATLILLLIPYKRR